MHNAIDNVVDKRNQAQPERVVEPPKKKVKPSTMSPGSSGIDPSSASLAVPTLNPNAIALFSKWLQFQRKHEDDVQASEEQLAAQRRKSAQALQYERARSDLLLTLATSKALQ